MAWGDHKSPKPYGGGRTTRPKSVYLDTRGQGTLSIGICQRCNFKFYLGQLQDDPNIKGFKVCKACRDDFDPYRMPARQPEKITPAFVRPDVGLEAPPGGFPPITGEDE
jgi:hypothetical protein